MLSSEDSPPVDRPNLSKDYLAGNAQEDWVPLRSPGFYADHGIDLRLNANVVGIDVKSRTVACADGKTLAFDRLLLATGAEPNRLSFPGSESPQVHTLRSLSDCRAIIARAGAARRAVVVGASFIGLEVAAALRTRQMQVDVVAPEARPMERILGAQLGEFVRALHEEHGVKFHLEETVKAIDGVRVILKSGATLDADLVVMGVGVRARTALAGQAGLAMDRGVLVNSFLETSVPGVFAAGDIARWPDPHSGEPIRVEHWVVAQRQGQTAARNMLGYREKFDAVPFFWSQHYDVPINYVGHAEKWDDLEVDGDIKARDCLVRYKHGGRMLAAASIYRDVDSLKAELALEQEEMSASAGGS
jgi:NADPH-dependent 2,4-dienoyl-CoA reductase/sulfur reductase-like enzyme